MRTESAADIIAVAMITNARDAAAKVCLCLMPEWMFYHSCILRTAVATITVLYGHHQSEVCVRPTCNEFKQSYFPLTLQKKPH